MKKLEKKALNKKILFAFEKILESNNTQMTDKAERIFKKSIKQIIKSTHKKVKKVSGNKVAVPATNIRKTKAREVLQK